MQYIVENSVNDKILDVGCGIRPRGDVNLDLTESENIPNFVLGDALDLPFDENSFATVYSSGLSLWSTDHDDSKLLKSWQEAVRVAKDQVVMEYNYTKQSKQWRGRHPIDSLNWLQSNLSNEITLEYSERGKFSNLIRPFEKIFGKSFTIVFLNKIMRRSYYSKFKLKLSEKENLPEVKWN
ncbi:MAG: hypothetical protein HeimC2_18740 [Candidatus Heimdallarchaeota archaeon LC_2]|nr:MAG: hypothetical protein HeimC2_18740 [Candidatus Heimdallarchaeota archaeon LC_2]